MAKLSLSPKFIKEVFLLFYERPLKEMLFGKRADLSAEEKNLLDWIKAYPDQFKTAGGRKGEWSKVDLVHKGTGAVYLLPNQYGDEKNQSLLLFDSKTKITNGPDLWVYLSSNENIKKDGLDEYLVLQLMKGNGGGQSYIIDKPLVELEKYKSVVIWCKQFSVLFTFATLS